MNVLMIYPNRYRPHVAPVGLEYVCNSLRWAGIPFRLFDLNFEPADALFRVVRNDGIDLVGINVRNIDANYLLKNEYFVPALRDLVHRIKQESRCRVVLGGGGFSLFPREVLSFTGADFGVVGYGEKAMPELVRALENGTDLAAVDNLAWRDTGGIRINRQSRLGYEALPPHRRDIARNRDYYGVFRSGNIEAKRGCYQRCGYCAEPAIVGRDVVVHSVENVIEELKELRSLGITNIHFCDSEFNVGPPEFVDQLCRAMIDRQLGIAWSAYLHPDPGSMPAERLHLMKKAGCREIGMSVDSGAETILNSMEKRHSVEDVVVLSRRVRDAGIQLCQTYLIGWPGESTETIGQTLQLMKLSEPTLSVVFAGVRIVPNTKLEQMARTQGLVGPDCDLLTPVFVTPDRVIGEFMPYLRRHTRTMTNCVLPDRLINFYNIVVQNVYLQGFQGSYADFMDHVKAIPLGRKIRLFAGSVFEYALPGRNQFIPKA